ncbi:MAG: amidase family protein [Acidobacteriota bacterium]
MLSRRKVLAGLGLLSAIVITHADRVQTAQQPWVFRLEEATIADVQRAIQEGQTTCRGVVQAYVNRARAYNGTANQLVTDETASKYLPNYDEYRAAVEATKSLPDGDPKKTPPIELGRWESTSSDPETKQQYGMLVGIPNAGQLRALSMINIRGERSVTCKGEFDNKTKRPAGAPKVCDEFSQQPDALERAAELDAQYGRNPDLNAMPMYCVPFSFKDPYDVMDLRSTGGADARYDMDFAPRDQTLVAQLRKKGAIIYAKANTTEYNGRGGNPGGKNYPTKILPSTLGYQRSSWGGNPVNSYDTTRAGSIGSSSGSGVSVGSNLVMCSLCEETGASCRGPANHNSDALILPHKAMLSFHGGAIGASIFQDRAGIICRNVVDSVKVLDALKDPVNGYYDPRDIFTTVPRSSYPTEPFIKSITAGTPGALKGMRIGIIREFMTKQVAADNAIVDAAGAEMKAMLGDFLGATLVESTPAGFIDDPAVENMSTSFDKAIAALAPVLYPELLFELTPAGQPKYPEFAAKIEPTEFAPGKTFGTGTMQPIDWMVRWADGLEKTPAGLNLRSVLGATQANTFRFHISQYLERRAQDWKARGFTETLNNWAQLNARSKFWGDDQRAAFKNWEEIRDIRDPFMEQQGIPQQIQLREFLRRVVMKVMQENKLDVLVQVHSTQPPGKIGLAPEPYLNDTAASYPFGPNAGLTEVLIPAGYVRTVYDPSFVLTTDANGKKVYRSRTGTTPLTLPEPGLPFSINFIAEPGMEPLIFKVATAYQSASHRRVSPPMFGPVPGEPGASPIVRK